MLATLTVSQRLTVVETLGSTSEGGSLAGQNVHALPAGVLVYVAEINRQYQLRKNLPVEVIPDASDFSNVVAANGSSHTDGYFVATTQMGSATLVGGEASVDGFDLSKSGHFLYSVITPGGTLGKYVVFTVVDNNTLAIQSESSDDTSTYFFTYVETP